MLDTLAVYPGSSLLVSLALDAEPAIAFPETPAGGPASLRFARRSGTIWTLTQLDSDAVNFSAPSLAINSRSLPNIAYTGRSAATPSGFELVLLVGAGSNGPFTPTVVDSEDVGPVALAWDWARNRPYVNYLARRFADLEPEYRVAYRDNGGNWPRQVLGPPGSFFSFAVSLALDPLGAVGAAWLRVIPIAPNLTYETNACGFVETGNVQLSRQPAAVPSGAVTHTEIPPVFIGDATCSRRAVSSHYPGTFDVCWREPRVNCAPFAILYTEVASGATGVPFGTGVALASLDLAPTPWRGTAPLRVYWAQHRAAEARLEVHDLAGRVLASHDAGHVPAGAHELAWRPAALPPGLYWVTLQLDGVRSATRTLVSR